MEIQTFSLTHPLWTAYLTHLDHVGMTRWAVAADGQPLAHTVYLGAVMDEHIAGHISLLRQPINIPAADQPPAAQPLTGGAPLEEFFVQTFAVEVNFRRRGCGRALQLAALQLARELGLYQLRSWSSYDHPENYALKLYLGFAACPTVFETGTGLKIGGVYFVKTV